MTVQAMKIDHIISGKKNEYGKDKHLWLRLERSVRGKDFFSTNVGDWEETIHVKENQGSVQTIQEEANYFKRES